MEKPKLQNISFDIKTVTELREYASKREIPADYKIAVGSLIFDKEGKLILIERGSKVRDNVNTGKLEGIGGSVDEGEEDLHQVLLREVSEEVGADVRIEISGVATVLTLQGEKAFWVVPIYLCRLQDGELKIMEPQKMTRILRLELSQIDPEQLTPFQKQTMVDYGIRFGNKPFYAEQPE